MPEQGRDEGRIEVRDERRQPFHVVDKLVTWFWLPFIGERGYALYNLFISLVNHKSGAAFPSVRRIAAFLGTSRNTVRKYSRLLEEYGLIRIEPRQDPRSGEFTSHLYFILDPPPLPENLNDDYERRKLVDSSLMELRRQMLLAEQGTVADTSSAAEASDTDAGDEYDGGSTIDPPHHPTDSGPSRGGSMNDPPGSTSNPGGSTAAPPGSVGNPGGSAADPKREPDKENQTKETNANNNSPHQSPEAHAPSTAVVDSDVSQGALRKALQDLGVHPQRAGRLVREYDNSRIRDLYDSLLYLIRGGRQPRDPAAWLVAAITDGYQPNVAIEESRGEQAREQRRQEKVERFEEALQEQKRKEREEFERTRSERLSALGVTAETSQLWAQVIAELKSRGTYSPIFEMAFLERVDDQVAHIRVETEFIKQIVERNQRPEALRAALHTVLGRSVYLSISA
jgi:hypothetical protein